MPKIVDKEKMQDNILNAGLSAFLKYGFHKTTMTKIAQEAGIAKGTLYLYFDSKEDLTQTITEVYFKAFKERLIASYYLPTLDVFLSHIENSLLINDEDSKFIPIFFEAFSSSFRSEIFIKKYETFFDEIGDFYAKNLQLLMDNGSIDKSIKPSALGRILVSILDGIVIHKGFFSISHDSHKKMVLESLALFRRGLVK